MPNNCGDDCDLNHCPKCGGHTEGFGICDGCVAARAGESAMNMANNSFGGNYEEMNRVMGY